MKEFDNLKNNNEHIIQNFEKGGEPIGTIRDWKDGKYVKLVDGWKKLPKNLQHVMELSEKMKNIIINDNLSLDDKFKALESIGITDTETLVKISGKKASDVISEIKDINLS